VTRDGVVATASSRPARSVFDGVLREPGHARRGGAPEQLVGRTLTRMPVPAGRWEHADGGVAGLILRSEGARRVRRVIEGPGGHHEAGWTGVRSNPALLSSG
jgi:hypothetical protein